MIEFNTSKKFYSILASLKNAAITKPFMGIICIIITNLEKIISEKISQRIKYYTPKEKKSDSTLSIKKMPTKLIAANIPQHIAQNR